jgi:capsular polysaccharide biosynthesis protein
MELEILFRILIQKWRIIVPVFIVTLVATAVFTFRQPSIYEAKATYVATLSPAITDNRDFAAVMNVLSSRIEISTTYAEVANSHLLKTIAGENLGLPPEVLRGLSVNSRLIAGTNIIEIAVQGTNPGVARDFANAVGASTIDYVRGLYETFTLSQLDAARTPGRPIQPNVTLNLLLGAILGLVVGVGIVLITHYVQMMEKDPKEMPADATTSDLPRADDISILQLRQDILAMHVELGATRLELVRLQASLQKTNNYATESKTVGQNLESHLEGYHSTNGNKAPTKDSEREESLR